MSKPDNKILFQYQREDHVITVEQSADSRWTDLLENFWNFLKGVSYHLPDINILEAIDLALDENGKEEVTEERSDCYVEVNIELDSLRRSLYSNLNALDAEAVASKLVALTHAGFEVAELIIPESKLVSNSVTFSDHLVLEYVDKVSIKPAKAKSSKKIKFMLELGQ